MGSMPNPAPSGTALVRRILHNNRGKIAVSVLFLSLWTAGEALVPALVGATIDAAIARPDPLQLALWLGLLVLTFAALSYGYRYGSRIANTVLNHETHLLRTRVTDRALDPRGSITRRLPGEVAALASVAVGISARASFLWVAAGTVGWGVAAAVLTVTGASFLGIGV